MEKIRNALVVIVIMTCRLNKSKSIYTTKMLQTALESSVKWCY